MILDIFLFAMFLSLSIFLLFAPIYGGIIDDSSLKRIAIVYLSVIGGILIFFLVGYLGVLGLEAYLGSNPISGDWR